MPATSTPIKLAALEADDLQVLSAHSQDAVFKVSDISWTPADQRVIVLVNRFAWEDAKPRKHKDDERRRAVLQFDKVTRFQAQGISPSDKGAVLSILAILFHAADAPAGTVSLVCSGSAVLKLDVECVEARLTDLGSAWSASKRPNHRLGKP
ncbi:MAG: DUF2948 family protein [Pseudomonadota bacterium]